MSQGDAKVSNANVIDLDSYEQLLDRFGSMIKALEKDMAKTKKLKNENSFLKTTCEQQKHLPYVTTCSHEELKLAHEELSVAHDNLA
jgi:S-adenosylmethionine hydrolase